LKSPDQAGRFVVVIVMLEPSDFFEDQIKECNAQAARAVDKSDREFFSRTKSNRSGVPTKRSTKMD